METPASNVIVGILCLSRTVLISKLNVLYIKSAILLIRRSRAGGQGLDLLLHWL